MLILVGFLSIPAGILWNSWNSAEFLDSGRIPRIPAGISGGMESIGITVLVMRSTQVLPVKYEPVVSES